MRRPFIRGLPFVPRCIQRTDLFGERLAILHLCVCSAVLWRERILAKSD